MAKGGTRAIGGTTEQQRLFCMEYMLNHGNGEKAAIAAGYGEKTAAATASRLLTYVNVQNLLLKLKQKDQDKAIVTKEQIAAELVKIGFSDIRKLFDEDNRLLNVKDIPDDIAASLSSSDVDQLWSQTEDGRAQIGETKKVKLWDKLKALSQLTELYGYNAPTKVATTNVEGKDVTPTINVTTVATLPVNEDEN